MMVTLCVILSVLSAVLTVISAIRVKKQSRERILVLGAMNDFEARLKKLESGIVPDYEEAKKAAKAMDDFSAGITGILTYDPTEALRKSRERRED